MSFYLRYVVLNALRRNREHFVMWLVWHVIPKEIRMWSVVRAFADATTTPPGNVMQPDEIGYSMVMKAMR